MDLKVSTPAGFLTLKPSFDGLLGPRVLMEFEDVDTVAAGRPMQISLQVSQTRAIVVLLTNFLLDAGKHDVQRAKKEAVEAPEAGAQAASEVE